MKLVRKLVTTILTFAIIFSVVAFAGAVVSADGDYSVTIKQADSDDKAVHTYAAYQIFKGTLSSNGDLTNIDWGTGVTDGALAKAKSADTKFASCTSAAEVASVLADNPTLADKFASAMSECLATASGTATQTAAGAPCTIELSDAGYYFVKDTTTSMTDGAYTKYILYVLGNEEVDAKSEVPSIDKVIDEGEGVNANVKSIGEDVDYKITSSVPSRKGYEKYFFVVTDKLSEGLTYKADTLKIKVGSVDLTKDTDYTVDTETVGTDTVITIAFKNFATKYNDGDAIVITYSATLNDDAVLGSEGNPNTVDLTYSNNPNVIPEGDPTNPDKPGSGDPVGITPEKTVKTFTTAIKITKVDKDGNVLTGAKFSVKANVASNSLVTRGEFQEDAAGNYYLLTSGTYTTTAPVSSTDPNYASTTVKYKLAQVTETVEDVKDVALEAFVDEDGVLVLEDVLPGDYTIKEIIAPDGYNLLTKDIIVTVDKTLDTDKATCTFSASYKMDGDTTGKTITETDGVFGFEIENNKGDALPSTGGMGTTILYVAGASIVAVCAVLLITKKRMSSK